MKWYKILKETSIWKVPESFLTTSQADIHPFITSEEWYFNSDQIQHRNLILTANTNIDAINNLIEKLPFSLITTANKELFIVCMYNVHEVWSDEMV